MDDIYMLADTIIMARIGNHLKTVRLKQNVTQQNLANSAGISLSSLKKMEKGEIKSFDSFLRILRTLGKLDVLQPLVDEEQLSPANIMNLCILVQLSINGNGLWARLILKIRRNQNGRCS